MTEHQKKTFGPQSIDRGPVPFLVPLFFRNINPANNQAGAFLQKKIKTQSFSFFFQKVSLRFDHDIREIPSLLS
jgi:hypothetical protein